VPNQSTLFADYKNLLGAYRKLENNAEETRRQNRNLTATNKALRQKCGSLQLEAQQYKAQNQQLKVQNTQLSQQLNLYREQTGPPAKRRKINGLSTRSRGLYAGSRTRRVDEVA